MASTLPPNILSYIGTHVRKKDRIACALVCKHWKEPFLNAYWGRLKIGHSGININTVLSNREFLINAHRVWAVEFDYAYLDDCKRLLEFQRSFPGIRYIQFFQGPNEPDFSNVIDWSLWKNLTHLHIKISDSFETLSFQRIFTNLSVLSCLVHLEFDQSYDLIKQPLLSWNDFESLHYHLPRLKYLRQDFPLKPITRDEIESIRAVEPAQTTTKIYFNECIDTHWLFYFASKYPNLRYFDISQYLSPDDYSIDFNPQQYQSDLQLLSTLDQFFPCLKQTYTVLRNKNMYLPFIFFKTLEHFGTKIEYITLRYKSPIENDDISRCIQPISESLKILYIYLGRNETIQFAVLSSLVTLCIHGSENITITADEILECFPALRSLSVYYVSLSLSTNTRTYTPHPLHKLEIEYSYTDDALHYLSLRCNQLKHVSLFDVRFDGINTSYRHKYEDKDNNTPGQLIFDMSMLNLDKFILGFMDMFSRNPEFFPRHYVIEQMENDNNELQTTQQPSRINWYHVYWDRTNRKQNISKWELGRRDIEFCQRYFKDFARRQKRGKEREDIKRNWLGYTQKRFWKKDLQCGVLVFRFKSVKNHTILLI